MRRLDVAWRVTASADHRWRCGQERQQVVDRLRLSMISVSKAAERRTSRRRYVAGNRRRHAKLSPSIRDGKPGLDRRSAGDSMNGSRYRVDRHELREVR
jgi:hypothetical protein